MADELVTTSPLHSQDEHPLRTGDNDNVSNTREHLSASLLGSQSDGHSVEEHKSSTNLTDEEQTQAVLSVDESEVYFLIADFLTRHSVCPKAANALIQELAEHQLLKSSVDWTGTSRTATYEDYRLRHRDLSSSHIVELLQEITTFSRLDGKNDGDKKKKKTKDVHTSLLLKTRVRRQLMLSLDESKKLAKDIVKQLFRLREVLKTVKVVEKVIKKYERYQKYTTMTSVEELPLELQLAMVDNDTGIKTDTNEDKVTMLAADVRALKQLFHLRQDRAAVEKQIHMLMERAKRSGLFQTTVRNGHNQTSLLQRREVSSQRDTQLPPAYVYSRIRRLKTLSGHLQIQAYCLAYDKLGKVVITGSDDRLVKIWSLRTGDLLFTLRGHVGNITDLAVNHANTLLASSSDDKTVRVWEMSTGAPVAVLVGHSSVVNAVRFHPSKNIIVTASDDGRCFCYKVPEIPFMDRPETKIETARRLYSLNAYMLSLHPIYAMKHAQREGVRSCKVHCVSFSRCGDFVASGGHDGIARVWDLSMVSAPDAPAVVPRFQPTDEPQEARAQEQQSSENGSRSDQQSSATIPFGGATGTQALSTPSASLQTPLVQQLIRQANDIAAPAASAERFGEVVTATAPMAPRLPPLQARSPMQPQTGAEVPLPTVAEGLQREMAPRQPQPPQVQNDLPSLSISDDDVPSIEAIALFKGHQGPVSSIVYNYRGDRIVTASIKDSVARVWKWKRKYKCVHGVVLFAKESPVEHDDISALYGIRGRKKAIPVVDMVAWTHDDRRLITLHSVKLNSEHVDAWEQRIRVWEPESGQLLMTLGAVDKEKKNGHVNAAFALSAHPTDWRIVVTAGYDGRVFLWDISTGRMLKSFTNLSPDSKPLSNLDGGFTPNGDGFCFTDQIGRLLIFGTGSGEEYAATPVQQYFLHDYVMLVTDGHYNVRDRETRELPSLMDSGPLMDASLVQYPHQPPHLLTNALISSEQYEVNRKLRIRQSKESEIRCAVCPQPETEEDVYSFPLAIVKNDENDSDQEHRAFAADAMAPARAAYRLNGAPLMLSELRRHESRSRRDADPRRRRETFAEERDTSVLEIEISSEDDRNDEDFQVPTPRHAAAEEEEEDEEEEDEDEDDFDPDDELSENEGTVISPANSRRRRLRSTRQREPPRVRFPARGGRRLQSNSEGEHEQDDTPRQLRARRNAVRSRSRLVIDSDAEEGGDEASDQHTGTIDAERDSSRRGGQDEVVVESNEGIIISDNQLDRFDQSVTYTQMLQAKRAQLGAAPVPAENGDDALIPCAFCGVGDDNAMLKLPGDGMGVHPLIYGAQRVFVHDQCAIASPLCFNRDGNWYNVTKEIRRGRSLICVACNKRGSTIGCTIAACRNSYHWKCAINFGWSVDQMHFFCPDHQSRHAQRHQQEENIQLVAEDGGAIFEPASKRFGLTYHRGWLQLVSLRSIHQYVPQVGDHVVYLPEGHPGYLDYGGIPYPRYFAQLSRFYAVKCRVSDVKYVFPTAEEHVRCDTIKCELLLAVLAVPTSAVRPARDCEEQKREEETKDDAASGTTDLFKPESSPFAEFTSVDQELSPTVSESSVRFNFKILYHSNDVANFLVLDHVYESGVCGNWRIGDRVQMPFVQLNEHGLEVEAKMSYGTIENICRKPLLSSRLGEISPWDCVKVNWDDPDDDTCSVCPWELEPSSPEERREKRELSLRRRSTRLYFSRSIIGEKCEALLQEVDQVLTLSISRDFMYPVDEETFLDYPISIANPIDLTKIQQRLRFGFYRQVEAFLADVKLLSINCETYNIPSSPISQNSRNLFSAVLTQAQRHFPHLLRDENRRDSEGELANVVYSYPPDDFLTNFSEDSEETQLELLEIGLLTPAPEESFSNSAAPVVSPVSPVDVRVSPAATLSAMTPSAIGNVDAVSPQATSRHRACSNEETKEDDAIEAKTDDIVEQNDEGSVDSVSSEEQFTTTNAEDGAATAVNSSRQLRNREAGEPQVLSPRIRRATRVATAPSTGSVSRGAPAQKRQRKNPDQELLTYSSLMDNYTSPHRDAVERACGEDLRAVLQVFHEALTDADKTDIFGSPVTDDVAPQYSEIIVHPMDFGTIQDKLDDYKSFRDYFADVELVFSNAITYNGWDCFVGGLVEDLQKYCIKFLLDAVGVNLQGHTIPAMKKARRPIGRASSARNKPSPAAQGKRRARRKPVAAISNDAEDSWSSSESEQEDDDDDDIEEDDTDFSDESDYGSVGRKRQLRRHASARESKKKKIKRRR
ncbi:unnamed protein product [Peronospora farinosa]|uniref:Bromodomain and WD repeat-containing protein 1 n=1 Tax=Peronospora farinosa TaxID=134698 RepID=A0AAV0UNK6_9STRA|nr:unnamed protein product [Peronospora farinosa]